MQVYKIGEIYVSGVDMVRANNKYIHEYEIIRQQDEIIYRRKVEDKAAV